MRHSAITALLVGTLVVAGCGGSDIEPTATSTTASAGEEAAVTIEDFEFMSETIEVTVGTTITWTNEDDFAHTVTSGSPGEQTDRFDNELGSLGEHEASGTMATYTVEEPGEISYFCRFHPRMTGTIVVTEEG
ncbi:MAG: plastocyanin/azurin family copper-binding protein [Nitriliruptorales bacterium]|nr:plastocyanin/azurin family copper-binding protein [Nitriliruptorales bacterium]